MFEPTWKPLVDRLKQEGFDSPYLDRLDMRLVRLGTHEGRVDRHARLEREILAEMAAALGRSEDKINVALLELQVAERELARAVGDERRRWEDEYTARRERAERARWELMVHREALGVYHHEDLDVFYPIPPPLPGRPGHAV